MNRWVGHYRLLAMSAVAAAVAGLAGCPPVRQGPPGSMPDTGEAAPTVGNTRDSAGIVVPLPQTEPLSGGALAKARTPRNVIAAWANESAATRKATPRPSTAAAASTAPAEDGPPPAALKAYLAAREKFIAGDNAQAIHLLDEVLTADPQSFSALRLMGRAQFSNGQLARGSIYLQHAAQINPDDVDVNLLLGRYWMEQKEWGLAIHHLMLADDSPLRNEASSLAPLSSFYLARALQMAGYHEAAAQEYERFLSISQEPVPAYRTDREMATLLETLWAVQLELAENYFLTGRFQQALPHYMAAAAERPADAYVIARLLSDQLMLKDFAGGMSRALDLVVLSRASDDSIQLLEWIYRRAGQQNELLPDMQRQVDGPGATSGAVLALAKLQERSISTELAVRSLTAFLMKRPADLDVLGRLVQMVVQSKTYDTEAFVRTAAALAAAPDSTETILKLYSPLLSAGPAQRMVAAATNGQFPANHPPALAGGMEHYLYGQVLRNTPHARLADAEFSEAVRDLPAYWPAREADITVLGERGKFSEAEALVKDATARGMGGVKTRQMAIALLIAEQRYAEAQTMAGQARDDFPDQPEFRLQLASIQRLRQHDDEAETELKRAVERFPANEKCYQPLIEIYLAHKQMDQAVNELGALLRNVPDSHFGRLLAAQVYGSAGRTEDAENILHKMLADNPDDFDALVRLASSRYAAGKPVEAETLLTTALSGKAAPPIVVETLILTLQAQQRGGEALTLAEKYERDNPDSDAFLLLRVSALTAADRAQEAETLLKQGAARLPQSSAIASALAQAYEARGKPEESVKVIQKYLSDNGQTAEQLYVLSHFQLEAGDEDGSNATLERALKLMPDHIGANNDLGFFWVDQGKNVDQSEAMIKKALENQPDNAAFVDSLAWVYYKRGQFDKAITQSERAVSLPGGEEPDILGHLGDALYRAGKHAEAQVRWQQALDMLPGTPAPPLDKLRGYLEAATKALKENREPALSPLAPGT